MPNSVIVPVMEERRKSRNTWFSVMRRGITSADYLRPQRWNWSALMRPLDSRIRAASQHALDHPHVKSLRYFWLDGVFATISENFYTGFVVLFALAYQATSSQIGLITAVGNLLGAAAFYPGAYFSRHKTRQMKLVLVSGGGISRLCILLMAAIPLVAGSPFLAIVLIIILNAARSFTGNFANPAWTSIVADIVPGHLRGRYFSIRNFAMGIAALAAAPAAGWLIKRLNAGSASGFFGYQTVFALAFVFGIVSAWFFSKIKTTEITAIQPDQERKNTSRQGVFSPATFGWFIGTAIIWNLAVQMSAPFFNVYMVEVLGADVSWVGYAVGMSSLAALAGQLFFGRILDRIGNLKTQLVSGFVIPFIPLVWLLFTRPWHVFFANWMGGFMWAGFNLTNFNLLLDLTPDESRPKYVAIYQTAVFISAVAGPLLGGLLIHAVNYRTVFMLSTAGRLAAITAFTLTVGLRAREKTDWKIRRII
ncbi:MAG: MFS transporter [Spirochaetales bacterium]|nr:MFS transporter [Spirochaetales bacterium]